MLDHQDGRCDYDPYDRYDVTWNEETFGHLTSEDIEFDPIYTEDL